MNSAVVIYALIAGIVAQSVLHIIERRSLYNRLMSRDLAEYKRVTNGDAESEPRKTAHDKAIEKWRKGS